MNSTIKKKIQITNKYIYITNIAYHIVNDVGGITSYKLLDITQFIIN